MGSRVAAAAWLVSHGHYPVACASSARTGMVTQGHDKIWHVARLTLAWPVQVWLPYFFRNDTNAILTTKKSGQENLNIGFPWRVDVFRSYT